MNQFPKRGRGRLAVAVLGLGLVCSGALDRCVRAQNPNEPAGLNEEPEKGTGRPFDGYMGTSILAFLALFLVGKSARR
jgi:hypothetical protein